MPKPAYANSPIVGTRLKPTRSLSSLQYNVANLAVGKKKVGSSRWAKTLSAVARAQEFEELKGVLGTRQKPKDPKFVVSMKAKNERPKSRTYNGRYTSPATAKKPQRFDDRIEPALVTLERCDPQHLSFLTADTSVETNPHNIHDALLQDGDRLERFIRHRFPGAMFVLIPESDQKLMEDIPFGLLPDETWRKGLTKNQLCYKNHFHGALYHPGFTTAEAQKMFEQTPKGKRSKLYSGLKQVCLIDFYTVKYDGVEVPDIRGTIGYAQKGHYRPPVIERMAEGFPEWLYIHNLIQTDPKLTRVGGFRHLKRKPKPKPKPKPKRVTKKQLASVAAIIRQIKLNREARQAMTAVGLSTESIKLDGSKIDDMALIDSHPELYSVGVSHSNILLKETKIKLGAMFLRGISTVKNIMNTFKFWDTS